MKLKSKSRIKKVLNGITNEFYCYSIQVQNTDGIWVNIACSYLPDKILAQKLKETIKNNPYLITGYGYLFDIDYE